MNIQSIIEDFEFLDEWEDRYKYLIEIGNKLEPLEEDERNASTKVQGCVSQVWVVSEVSGDKADPMIHFRGDSDAHIVRGLIAITLALFSGKSASQILAIDETETFQAIDLSDHITPQRSNGLRSMVARIKHDAKEALSRVKT